MTRGYYTVEKLIEQPDIPNLCWNNLPGAYRVTPWYCLKGHGQMKMELFPEDRREPAQYWECVSEGCKRRISIDRRDKTFLEAKEKLKEIYQLRILEYDHNTDRWTMESEIWLENRLKGKVKPIFSGERKLIISHLLEILKKELEIELESMRDYFIS